VVGQGEVEQMQDLDFVVEATVSLQQLQNFHAVHNKILILVVLPFYGLDFLPDLVSLLIQLGVDPQRFELVVDEIHEFISEEDPSVDSLVEGFRLV
jgi:hypothetical protein